MHEIDGGNAGNYQTTPIRGPRSRARMKRAVGGHEGERPSNRKAVKDGSHHKHMTFRVKRCLVSVSSSN